MIEFLRSFFGLNEESGDRKVIGGAVNPDAKDVKYIKDSNLRITALYNLYNRYKGTLHEQKIKEVYQKTKDIHMYLVYKKRVHELELFHLQHTDHFLNTFTVILDVHQKYAAPATTPTAPEEEGFFKNFKSATATLATKTKAVAEAVKPVAAPRPPQQVQGGGAAVVTLPVISIDSSSRIHYVSHTAAGAPVTSVIGFTSAKEEQDTFLAHVAARLGVYRQDVSYVGNAMLTLPAPDGSAYAGYVPVIHWKGCAYALNLSDYRLFPVKLYRRSL